MTARFSGWTRTTRCSTVVAGTLATASPGSAAVITVTTTADELNTDGDCSLREAVQAANGDVAVDGCPAGNGADTTASIIDIGHHLSMTVITEGVETQEQLDMLEAMGCDQAQGFFFSRGLPAEEFRWFLAEHRLPITEPS